MMKVNSEAELIPRQFRGDKLRLVREARGLSQTELSELAHIPQGSLSKFETEVRQPDRDQISQLARVLDVQPKYFFRQDIVHGVGPGEVFHRKRMLGKRTLDKIHARMNMVTMTLSDLLRSVEIPSPDLPQWDRDDKPDIELAAMALRRHWYVPDGPVRSVSELVHRSGILLIPFDFEGEKIDGIGRWPAGMPPFILYNPAFPDDRIRFTIMHEVAHFCLHHGQSLAVIDKTIEAEADHFASAFLLPAEQVRTALRGLSIPKIGALKLAWKSSMASLIYRARQLETISSRTADELWRQMGSFGYRTNEPEQYAFKVEDPGRRFRELVNLHIETLNYSVSELCDLVGLNERELRRTLDLPGPSRPHLSVVS